jgi:CheY-like chemotaxis protein
MPADSARSDILRASLQSAGEVSEQRPMDAYLTKPFDRDDLNRLLDRWCGDKDRTEAA